MKFLIIVAIVFVLWSVWGYFGSNVEQAEYIVLKNERDYEVREYKARIVAQTTVEGSYDESLNKGFTIIAGYIFGGNTAQQKIAMTAPVTQQNSEKVAMTAPVLASLEGNSRVISFVMPSSYTLQTLPVPNDARVILKELPSQKIAVIGFSWFRSETRVQLMQKTLLESLTRDGVQIVGVPSYAGYNAPWTPPWMNRNEVLVEIK